jgi:glycerol-3-phosphate O-acyltransferase
MKKSLYEKMKPLFPLMEHDYREIEPLEELIYRLAMGNTFNTRVVGLEPIKRFRRENPNCAVTFKPNHLSEADFVVLGVLFRQNGMRVLMEGGNNLFIEEIDIFRDVLPALIDPKLQKLAESHQLTIGQYLSRRGAFKVFRNPVTLKQPNGTDVKLGRKDILSLSRAYRQHLVEGREMYLTFPGYSAIRSSLLDLLKMNGTKTGRSYTGKIDGFHHLPFQMDIEAAVDSGEEVAIVPINLAYERVLEDENFQELTRMHEAGVSPQEIYVQDMGYIIRRFCTDKRKANLSLKFGEPRKIDTRSLRGDVLGTKIKFAAHTYAKETFERVMGMQPVFPANIYFSAFDEQFNRLSVTAMLEKIDDIRDHLRHLVWGRQRRRVDLHYVLGYNMQIMSAEEIINRTFEVFAALERPITSLDGNMFVVHNHDVAMQYRNHVAHFLEPAKK